MDAVLMDDYGDTGVGASLQHLDSFFFVGWGGRHETRTVTDLHRLSTESADASEFSAALAALTKAPWL
jgi:hypothetical protein